MRLADIMSTGVQTAGRDDPAETAWGRMRARRMHHLVVVDRGGVVGVLSDRDCGGARGSTLRAGRAVGDLMTPAVVAATPRTTIREAANLLRGRAVGCLPVLDRGKLVGIVTVSDLLELIGRGVQRPIEGSRRWTLRQRGPDGQPTSAPRVTGAARR